jgi:hypothetical protein
MPSTPPPKLSLTWADVLLVAGVLLAGMAAWTSGERLVAPRFEHPAPVRETFEDGHQVSARRVELTQAERTLVVLEERLREQRLEDMRQRAVIAAYETVYPRLRGLAGGPAPDEVRSGYVNAQMTASATEGYVQALEHDVARQDSTVSRARIQVRGAERLAAAELDLSRQRHLRERRWLDVGSGVALTVAALLALWTVVPWLARRLDVPVQAGLVFGVAGALLGLLVADHLFQRTGAVVAGTLLCLGLLVLGLRRPNEPAGQAERTR